MFIGITCQFWLNIISSILLALQKIILANSFNIISNVFVLIFLMFGKTDNAQNDLVRLSFVYILAICSPLVGATIYVFMTFFKDAIPRLHNFDRVVAKQILSLGSSFLVIQLGLLIINSTNPILITRFFGSESVVEYQMYYKIFSVASMIFTVFTQPIWSAITDAWARKNIKRIERLSVFLYIIAILGSVSTFVIIPFLQKLLNVWLGKNTIEVSITVALTFSVYSSCELLMLASTCIANGVSKLRCQLVCTIISALMKIPLTFLFSRIIRSWDAVILAHTIVLLPTLIAQPILLIKDLRIYKKNVE